MLLLTEEQLLATLPPVSYRAPTGVFKQEPSPPQFVQTRPVVVGVSSIPEAGYSTGTVPMPAGYYSAGSFMPGYDGGSQQAGAAQSSLPGSLKNGSVNFEMYEENLTYFHPLQMQSGKLLLKPEEASTDTQGQSSSASGPPLPPPAPAVQSGETSNVVKEAELRNFHQQTEEFGYPAMGPAQGFPPVVLSPGVWGYPLPYPDFDYRLLYGLYPPGTYTTFRHEHEKGKDYYQTIHYLKEHGSDAPDTLQNPGTGQQKILPHALKRS